MRHPTRFSGTYPSNWNGYYFKEKLSTGGLHTGVDYNYGSGGDDLAQDVVAIATGVVKVAGNYNSKGFGNTVIIEHPFGVNGGDKSYSRYMHLNDIKVSVGQSLSEGQLIGHLGKTGTSSPHLHLDLWSNKNGLGPHLEYHKNTQLESYVDPYIFINNNPNLGKGGSMAGIPDADNYYGRYNKAMNLIRGRDIKGQGFSREEFRKYFVGRSDLTMLEAMSDDPEADQAHEWMRIGFIANRDNWQSQIVTLDSRFKESEIELQAREAQIKELTKAIEIKDKEIERLKATQGESSKWEVFKALIKELIGK